MKYLMILVLFLSSFFGLLSCTSMKVSGELLNSQNEHNYSTFEVVTPVNLTDKVSTTNKTLIEESIISEVVNQLNLSYDNGAELTINYFVIVSPQKDIDAYVNYYGNRRWRYTTVTENVREYTEGSLIIDVIDKRKETIIWHGVATDILKEKQSDLSIQIQEASQKLISSYKEDITNKNS